MSVESMSKYSAKPPQTPAIFSSVRERISFLRHRVGACIALPHWQQKLTCWTYSFPHWGQNIGGTSLGEWRLKSSCLLYDATPLEVHFADGNTEYSAFHQETGQGESSPSQPFRRFQVRFLIKAPCMTNFHKFPLTCPSVGQTAEIRG